MSDLSGYTLRLFGHADLITETCYSCGVLFAMPADYRQQRLADRGRFHCPNGHGQHYTGPTDAQKLKQAEAREVALRDQVAAAVRDAEAARAALIRDRHRFANGVCPCCNRSFDNVRRHMVSKHPDYDVTTVTTAAAKVEHQCSCGRSFDTPRGLAVHQGRSRRPGWEHKTDRWYQHLTEVTR